jgi:hypothetical protein
MDKWFKDILPDKDPYHNRGRYHHMIIYKTTFKSYMQYIIIQLYTYFKKCFLFLMRPSIGPRPSTYKVRNKIETKRNEINENETKRSETKSTKTKRNQRNETKPTKAILINYNPSWIELRVMYVRSTVTDRHARRVIINQNYCI